MSNLKAILGVFIFTILAGSVCTAADKSAGRTDESVLSFLVPSDEIAKVKQGLIANPVRHDVVQAKIDRIAQKVQASNPQLLTSVQAKYADDSGIIKDVLMLSIVAQSPLFKSLGLSMEIATDRKFVKLRDRISLSATMEVSSYDILKSFLQRMAEDAIKVQEPKYASANEFLRDKSVEAARHCETFNQLRVYRRRDSLRISPPEVAPPSKPSYEFGSGNTGVPLLDAAICAYGHHLYESKSYSDFLERISPLMPKVRMLAGRELSETYGWFTVLAGYDLSICTKSNYTCSGEYLYLKGSFGVIASSISGAVKFEENRVTLEISAYSFRSLSEYFVDNGMSPDIDLAKYFVLKQIENMDDATIEAAAHTISDFIADSEKSINEFKDGSTRRLP